jgi:hypothetical protein
MGYAGRAGLWGGTTHDEASGKEPFTHGERVQPESRSTGVTDLEWPLSAVLQLVPALKAWADNYCANSHMATQSPDDAR